MDHYTQPPRPVVGHLRLEHQTTKVCTRTSVQVWVCVDIRINALCQDARWVLRINLRTFRIPIRLISRDIHKLIEIDPIVHLQLKSRKVTPERA